MSVTPLKVLVVEDSSGTLRECLDSLPDVALEVAQVSTVAEAGSRLDAGQRFDAVLIDTEVSDLQDSGRCLFGRAPTVACLVSYSDGAVHRLLEKGVHEIVADPATMPRSIRLAIQRHRLRQVQDQPGWMSGPIDVLQALTEGLRREQARNEGLFEEGEPIGWSSSETLSVLVERYRALLVKAVQQRAYKHPESMREEMRQLAADLGTLEVRPRDLVALHKTILLNGTGRPQYPLSPELLEEGRLLLLELMGHLMNYYRTLALLPRSTSGH